MYDKKSLVNRHAKRTKKDFVIGLLMSPQSTWRIDYQVYWQRAKRDISRRIKRPDTISMSWDAFRTSTTRSFTLGNSYSFSLALWEEANAAVDQNKSQMVSVEFMVNGRWGYDNSWVSREPVTALHKAGVPILCGTNTNRCLSRPAKVPCCSNIHTEIQLLMGARISLLEVVLSDTLLQAKYFGLSDQIIIMVV